MSNKLRPDHYNKGIEAWDYIQSWDMNFMLGNVVKYITRAGYKDNELEDLQKAKTYLDEYIKRKIEKNKQEPEQYEELYCDHCGILLEPGIISVVDVGSHNYYYCSGNCAYLDVGRLPQNAILTKDGEIE